MSTASPVQDAAAPTPARAGPRYRFVGEFPSAPLSGWYSLSLLITAATLVLVPLMYLGLIVGIGWGVVYHAQHSTVVFDDLGSQSGLKFWAIVFYLCPIVIGVATILFLLKPFIAGRAKAEHPITLDPSQEPVLFKFVEELCTAIGAPVPREIQVHCEPNASAGFWRAFRGLVTGRLCLVIGLPFAAGLTMRQFAGVLAHEFGHFRQGSAMRLAYFIDGLNGWLIRAAFQRDEWDDWIEAHSRSGVSAFRPILYGLRGMVWLTRRVIFVFFWIGHAVSCHASRQMEYDADRVSAAVSGSTLVGETLRKTRRLAVAWDLTIHQLQRLWNERRLVDNLPLLVAKTARDLPKPVVEAVEKSMSEQQSGRFDTHPAPVDRIAAAERLALPGILQAEGPALALFTNFTMIGNGVTLRYYRDVVGLAVGPENLIPVDAVHQRAKTDERAYKSMLRYFQDCLSFARPFDLPGDCPAADDLRAVAARIRALRARFEADAPRLAEVYQRRRERAVRMRVLARADALTRCGVNLPVAAWGLTAPGLQAVTAAARTTEREIAEIDSSLLEYRQLACDRLVSALQLGASPQVIARMRDGDARTSAARAHLEIAARMASLAPLATAMHSAAAALESLFRRCPDGRVPDQYPLLLSVAANLTETINQNITEIRDLVVDLLYPFEHAHGPISLANFLGSRLPPKHTAIDAYLAGREMLERLNELHVRVLGNLALYAESVEAVLGLARLSDPPQRQYPTDEEPEEPKPKK